ncbi:TraR/DksA C4-type zinc finger protein [Vibrio metschnikovii]|nr:TraR/DksA C4-type zinc finger protein [Vibrio metschnikovii]EKO3597891.1 TraR/DksA C4-type zinc finger protein [Vibrio metschnikovii]EKO3709755.1 TraR/DksA C4-type zinc finger protein [Vibrio metschnikovii]EKO3730368.1 TraR/DksA C4-type zinc finger protein [Vibrio metschnikovii]EKO3902544.1 TraR/DksA C4-type zinc finger protein [Vibrio metschnikovii]
MNIDYFKIKLQAQEMELLEELETSEQTGSRDTVQLDQQSVGRLSRIDAMQGQQMALEQQRRRQRQLLAIRSALRRIEEKDYGYCVQCGEEINPKRLDVNPCAVKCIHCAK